MSNKMTISCEANLADVELLEGLYVQVQDSGAVFKCIATADGRLRWEAQSHSRYDFPETSTQLQEIEIEDSRIELNKKNRAIVSFTRYLH